MGVNNRYKGTCTSNAALVNKYIGTAYDHVKTVSDNIEDVKTIADALGNEFPDNGLDILVENIDDVVTVATNIDDVTTVAGISADVTTVASIKQEILDVPSYTYQAIDAANAAEQFANEAEGWANQAQAGYVGANGIHKGDYAVGVEYVNYNDYYTYDNAGTIQQWSVLGNVALPYTTTEANPANDANLTLRGDASQAWVESGVANITATGSTAPRALADRFADIVNVKDFGVIGGGIVDERDLLAEALQASAGKILDLNGLSIKFGSDVTVQEGTTVRNGHLIHGSGYFRLTNGNTRLENVKFTGTTAVGCYISGDNYTIEGCTFDGSDPADSMGQVVLLLNGNYLTVKNSIFRQCTYGIIQQAGRAFNNVLIEGNHCYEATADFVEANSASVDAENWTITGNFYTGSKDFPAAETENRFVGITQVKNVIITDNIVQNVNGDAPVHLEDTLGCTIVDGNIFENWNSNQGAIYLLSTSKDSVISNNIFIRSRTDAAGFYGISDQSNQYTNELVIDGNLFVDYTGEQLLVGCRLAAGSNAVINGNVALNCNSLLYISSYNKVSITGNKTENCLAGVRAHCDINGNADSPSGASLRDSIISGNFFNLSTDGNAGICCSANSNGTGGPYGVVIVGNWSNGRIGLTGTASSSNSYDNVITSNYVTSGGSYATPGGTLLTPDSRGNFQGTN